MARVLAEVLGVDQNTKGQVDHTMYALMGAGVYSSSGVIPYPHWWLICGNIRYPEDGLWLGSIQSAQ